MRIADLHLLPKVRDASSFVYLERGRLEQDDRAVAFVNELGRVALPVANIALIMLGPGTTVTHRAVVNATECGCSIAWVGEEGVRMYASGLGATRSARRLLRQVELLADDRQRMRVVREMYTMRFDEPLPPDATLRQIRGAEGARVRDTYRRLSREYDVPWSGRRYRRDRWEAATPINRALSAANSCLYGICHAAIVNVGYSPALGFIHTGKALSFVYDVADIYKTETSIPAAFRAVGSGAPEVERAARHALREEFHTSRLLSRIVDDLARLFRLDEVDDPVDGDLARPGGLWDPEGIARGGINHGEAVR
jgi:CRISPR-associated protein Cas1